MSIQFTPSTTDKLTRAQWVDAALGLARDHVPGIEITEEKTGYRDAGTNVRFQVAGLGKFELPWAEHEPGDVTQSIVAQLNARGGI